MLNIDLERLKKSVLVRPVITEKATFAKEKKWYVFYVEKFGCKLTVKKDVEDLFDAKVSRVSIVAGKKRRVFFRGIAGKKTTHKKAFVKVKEAGKLDEFFGGFAA